MKRSTIGCRPATHLPRPVVVATLVMAVQLVAACGDTTTEIIVPLVPPAPPAPGLWHQTTSDGQPMPALVGHRLVMGDLEQTFADSVQLEVAQDGSWVIRSWLTQYRNGLPSAHLAHSEFGTWQWDDTAYVFTSAVGRSRGWMRDPARAPHTFWLRHASVDGIAVATFDTLPPPHTAYGMWCATAVDGAPLPQVHSSFDPHEEGGVLKSIHFIVDSATFGLHPTGHYSHRIWISEWEGLPGGGPTTRRYGWPYQDAGEVERLGRMIRTESYWLQHHRMTGVLPRSGFPLLMSHPVSHGEAVASFHYAHLADAQHATRCRGGASERHHP